MSFRNLFRIQISSPAFGLVLAFLYLMCLSGCQVLSHKEKAQNREGLPLISQSPDSIVTQIGQKLTEHLSRMPKPVRCGLKPFHATVSLIKNQIQNFQIQGNDLSNSVKTKIHLHFVNFDKNRILGPDNLAPILDLPLSFDEKNLSAIKKKWNCD